MYPQAYQSIVTGLGGRLRRHLERDWVPARMHATGVGPDDVPPPSGGDIRAEIAELMRERAPGDVGPVVREWLRHITLLEVSGPREEHGERVRRFLDRAGMVFVLAHSVETSDSTSIPPGMTVYTYTRERTVLPQPFALVALLTEGESGSIDEYTAKRSVPNFTLYEITDAELRRALTVAAGGEAHFMYAGSGDLGDGIRLCNTPDICKKGEHNCGGVLDICKKYKDVHLLICRYSPDNPEETLDLGAELQQDTGERFRKRFRGERDRFLELSDEKREKKFLSWDPQWQAMMLTSEPIAFWKNTYDAKAVYRDSGSSGFALYAYFLKLMVDGFPVEDARAMRTYLAEVSDEPGLKEAFVHAEAVCGELLQVAQSADELRAVLEAVDLDNPGAEAISLWAERKAHGQEADNLAWGKWLGLTDVDRSAILDIDNIGEAGTIARWVEERSSGSDAYAAQRWALDAALSRGTHHGDE